VPDLERRATTSGTYVTRNSDDQSCSPILLYSQRSNSANDDKLIWKTQGQVGRGLRCRRTIQDVPSSISIPELDCLRVPSVTSDILRWRYRSCGHQCALTLPIYPPHPTDTGGESFTMATRDTSFDSCSPSLALKPPQPPPYRRPAHHYFRPALYLPLLLFLQSAFLIASLFLSAFWIRRPKEFFNIHVLE
jgi:hypothetical protein